MTEKTFGPFELHQAYSREAVPEDFQQRRRIRAAMQTLAERLMRVEVEQGTLESWAEQLEALVANVGTPAQRDPREANRRLFTGSATLDDIFHMMDYDAINGQANPVAPQVNWLEEGQEGVEGELFLGLPYQGPPGRVHGGVIAWILDAVLARAMHASFRLGVTGTLNIRYLASTPLQQPLRCRARVTGQEGRKIFVEGGIWHGDTQTVQAQGIWLTPKSLG